MWWDVREQQSCDSFDIVALRRQFFIALPYPLVVYRIQDSFAVKQLGHMVVAKPSKSNSLPGQNAPCTNPAAQKL